MPNTLQLFNQGGSTRLVADASGDLSLFRFDQNLETKISDREKLLTVEGQVVFGASGNQLLALEKNSITFDDTSNRSKNTIQPESIWLEKHEGLSDMYTGYFNSKYVQMTSNPNGLFSQLKADGVHVFSADVAALTGNEMHLSDSHITCVAYGSKTCNIQFDPSGNQFKFSCTNAEGLSNADLIVSGRIMDNELRGSSIPNIRNNQFTDLDVNDLSTLHDKLGYTLTEDDSLIKPSPDLPLDMTTVTMTSLMDIIVRLNYYVQKLNARLGVSEITVALLTARVSILESSLNTSVG